MGGVFNFPLTDNYRDRMLAIAMDFMRSRMGIPESQLAEITRYTKDKNLAWVEYAHTPHLFHLGTVRVMLEAATYSELSTSPFIFFVNDHLPARELSESRYFPFFKNGRLIAKAPTFGLSTINAKRGMCHVPAPSFASLKDFKRRWEELEPAMRSSIDAVMNHVFAAASETRDYASFLTRVMLQLLNVYPICVASSELIAAFPEWREILGKSGRLWSHCLSCGYRLNRMVGRNSSRCCLCGSNGDTYLVPDVVGRQIIANGCGFAVRFCGKEKKYQLEADEVSAGLGLSVPKRMHVTGRTRVRNQQGVEIDRVNVLQWYLHHPTLLEQSKISISEDIMLSGEL